MLASLAISQLAALPDALIALWLMLLGEGVVQHKPAMVYGATLGLGVSAAATWFLRTLSTRLQRRFRDKVTIALESHVAQLQATIATIAHQERPEYLDRLSMLRNQVFVLDHMYASLFSTLGWILRLAVTMALLASIHPALLALAVFAVPTVVTSSWRPAIERNAQERGAQANRLSRHLFTLATTASPGKEVRVTGIGAKAHRGSPSRLAKLVRACGVGAVACSRMGDIRLCLCRRGGVRLLCPARVGRPGITGSRRGCAPFGIHRRNGRRDWVSSRILGGWVAPPCVA
jgi:hypothetical protein